MLSILDNKNNLRIIPSRIRRFGFVSFIILFALLPLRVFGGEVIDFEEDWKSGWSVTGLHGWFTDDATITETITFDADLDTDYRFAGVAVNKRFLTLWSYLELEGEFQMIKHYSSQQHGEFVGLAALRWRKFPWDRWLQTGVAVGAGVSLVTDDPKFELKHKGETARTLAYLLVEAEIGLRQYSEWSLVGRIHHRSSAFNTFTNGHASSNAYVLGLKYRF